MPIKNFKPNMFIASSPRSGDANTAALFRAKNMWVKGSAPNFYAECYSGEQNLGETIPTSAITGTITVAANSNNVVGTGTAFYTELRTGQYLYAGGELLVVRQITSDTVLSVFRAPTVAITAQTARRLPVLFPLDRDRGSLIRGNALKFEQGTIIAVGDGTLRRNGAVLPGVSMVASKAPKIAIYNPTTATFTIFTLGLTAPTGITGINVGGGTRGMTAGSRSYRFTKARKSTNGYGNPGEKVLITTAAGEKNRITFPAMDTANGQDAWVIFGTVYESTSSLNPAEGPWYKIRLITTADVSAAGGTYDFEVLNAEISRSEFLSFNNDAPPDADFVAALIGYPIYVSCQGKGTVASPNGTSPGPFIVPSKPNNVEAAPLVFPNPVSISPPEDIIGFVEGEGRIFLQTANRLAFASFTGNAAFPVTIRPYWKRGFANPYSLLMVDGELFGSTTSGMMRSIASAETAVQAYSFSADVEELLSGYNVGHRLVAYDPQNEAVCVFYSGAYKNDAGYWVTVCLPYLLRQGFWNPPIVIESTTKDMIVSGAATVGDHLEFLAGGAKSGTATIESETYRFDTGSNQEISWYLAWGFSDDGAEEIAKHIKGFRVKGKYSNCSIGIHGARSNEEVDVDALEEGNEEAASGEITIDDTPDISISEWNKVNVRELLLYTVRISGTWSGSGNRDRVDEVSISVNAGGFRK